MGGMRVRQFSTEGEPNGGAGPVCTVHSMQVVGPATTTEGQHLENCGVVTRSKTKIKKRLTIRNYRGPLLQNRKTHTLGWEVVVGVYPSMQSRYTGAVSEVDLPNRGPSGLSEGEVNAVSVG